jgi:hypothetical protein
MRHAHMTRAIVFDFVIYYIFQGFFVLGGFLEENIFYRSPCVAAIINYKVFSLLTNHTHPGSNHLDIVVATTSCCNDN